MRGLPELLNFVDDIYKVFEEPQKDQLTVPTLPLIYFEERPSRPILRAVSRPILRHASHRLNPYPKSRNEIAKTKEQQGLSFAFDVSSYKPEEISVRMKDRDIIVEAKHEEREDEHGYISRQFTRRYVLPDDYDPDTVSTYLSADGKMTIKALKPKAEAPHERIIPIKRVVDEKIECEEETMTLEKKGDSIESDKDKEKEKEKEQQKQQEP